MPRRIKGEAQCFIGGSTRLMFGTGGAPCRLQNRSYWSLDALCLRGENFAEDSIHGERSDTCDGGRMITAGLGVILPTLFYGGLLAICIFLLGQLLPIVYAFVSEGL